MKRTNLSIRSCPICGGGGKDIVFPYGTVFNKKHFSYIKCDSCRSVYVDPTPDSSTFALMYDKSNYHNVYYSDFNLNEYEAAINVLKKFLTVKQSTVLDYGCGMGFFLKLLSSSGFKATGVEFDKSAANHAAKYAKCQVLTTDVFNSNVSIDGFDCIHFGDVLEHLPDPYTIMHKTLKQLKVGGVLFVEGPLEINPSPVYYSALFFALLKHVFDKSISSSHAPTHLFRVGAKQQINFFNRFDDLELLYWEVYDTGFPYSHGNFIKKLISKISKFFSGKSFLNFIFGNRFRVVFIKKK